jgi:hypothetical protein
MGVTLDRVFFNVIVAHEKQRKDERFGLRLIHCTHRAFHLFMILQPCCAVVSAGQSLPSCYSSDDDPVQRSSAPRRCGGAA